MRRYDLTMGFTPPAISEVPDGLYVLYADDTELIGHNLLPMPDGIRKTVIEECEAAEAVQKMAHFTRISEGQKLENR